MDDIVIVEPPISDIEKKLDLQNFYKSQIKDTDKIKEELDKNYKQLSDILDVAISKKTSTLTSGGIKNIPLKDIGDIFSHLTQNRATALATVDQKNKTLNIIAKIHENEMKLKLSEKKIENETDVNIQNNVLIEKLSEMTFNRKNKENDISNEDRLNEASNNVKLNEHEKYMIEEFNKNLTYKVRESKDGSILDIVVFDQNNKELKDYPHERTMGLGSLTKIENDNVKKHYRSESGLTLEIIDN